MFPRWFRSNFVKGLAILATAPSAWAANPAPPAKPAPAAAAARPAGKIQVRELPELLQKVQSKYIRAGTLMAEFTQVNKSGALKTEKTSSGILMAKRPNGMRWETIKPEKNLLVSDGRKFWFYTPPFDEGERGQVVERKSSQVQSRLANALISGSFSELQSMKITKSGSSEFTLTPKKGTAATVIRAKVEIDPAENLIHSVTLFHEGGNESRITLSHIKLGEPIDDRLFHFIPPPGTDQING